MGGRQSPWFYSGRVEVRHKNGSWGTICNDRFDNKEAFVICKMFGFQYGTVHTMVTHFFGQGTGRIFMDELNCNGNETSIMDCPYNSWGRHNCRHSQDAGVQCSSDGDKSEYVLSIMHFNNFRILFYSRPMSGLYDKWNNDIYPKKLHFLSKEPGS